MAESDRSRSPPSQRNRSDARGPLHNGPLPGFPRWCGPMGAAVRHLNNMPRPQLNTPWMMQQSGPYTFGPRGMNTSTSPQWPSQPFPPVPPGTPPATLPYPRPPGISTSHYPSTPLCSPTQPCSPGTPSISPSQPRSAASPHGDIHSPSRVNEGFDLNASWQADKDHFDNQKANGLTFPRTIRQSAFTQRLDIEGCDTLTLPVAALLYQQANNNWLRKLAHGREVYLIPTGDIRSCGIHDGVAGFEEEASIWTEYPTIGLDRMAKCWIKPRTPSMLLSKSFKAGFLHGPPIQNPSKRSPSSAINLLNSSNNWELLLQNLLHRQVLHRQAPILQAQPLVEHYMDNLSILPAPLHQLSILAASCQYQPPLISAFWTTHQAPWPFEPTQSGSKNSLSLTRNARCSIPTLKRWKNGGNVNPLELWTLWSESRL